MDCLSILMISKHLKLIWNILFSHDARIAKRDVALQFLSSYEKYHRVRIKLVDCCERIGWCSSFTIEEK